MFKKIKFLALFSAVLFSIQAFSKVEALFSPHQGKEAFTKLFNLIGNAKSDVKITLYSWSDYGLDNAIEQALSNGVDVKVVLHAPLAKKAYLKKRIDKLENFGAKFKYTTQNMHEKFTIVDGIAVVNGSANISRGGRDNYSENMIFHYNDDGTLSNLLKTFSNEFALLWNTSVEYISSNEGISESLAYEFEEHAFFPFKPTFVSSSMNFSLKDNRITSKNYKKGRYQKLVRVGGTKNQTTIVSDKLIEAINAAEKQILVSVNHFNIRKVSDALIEAVKRGVDVRLSVDNQEYKSRTNGKEMTPQFMKDWSILKEGKKAMTPVRVKFYSHAPSPKYWLLNHHKFLLIDYEKSGRRTKLVSGSYNVSMNAEHNQFDNLVFYSGEEFKDLYHSFRGEFKNLWNFNRDRKGEILKKLLNPINETIYRIHAKEAVSLTWKEVAAIRKKIQKDAKGMFKNIFKHRDCKYFDVKTNTFKLYNFEEKSFYDCAGAY